mmetsp:Transcript_1620/g.1867  ORF Transcript_1620/g.1867 Transcript_1620/m.1867 type:complete len:260 (+) Transcript_1620:103-882(+)
MTDNDIGGIGGGGGEGVGTNSGGGMGGTGGMGIGGTAAPNGTTGDEDIDNSSSVMMKKNGVLTKLFSSCSPDPRGSVHRAWGISLLFVVLYFALSIFEMVSLQQAGDGSIALIVAAVWTGFIHLALGVLGTFVLKRFPTSFSVGFFLGVLVVLANQNIVLYASFHKYTQGNHRANQVFASLGFVLFVVLSFMSLLLVHFKEEVVVSPIDDTEDNDGAGAGAGMDNDTNMNNNMNTNMNNGQQQQQQQQQHTNPIITMEA